MIIHENDWYYGYSTIIVLGEGKALCKITIDDRDQEMAWLSTLIVHPSIQRQGYGNKLLELAIQTAKDKGAKYLYLSADGWRVDWYKRHGFIYRYDDKNNLKVMKMELV